METSQFDTSLVFSVTLRTKLDSDISNPFWLTFTSSILFKLCCTSPNNIIPTSSFSSNFPQTFEIVSWTERLFHLSDSAIFHQPTKPEEGGKWHVRCPGCRSYDALSRMESQRSILAKFEFEGGKSVDGPIRNGKINMKIIDFSGSLSKTQKNMKIYHGMCNQPLI